LIGSNLDRMTRGLITLNVDSPLASLALALAAALRVLDVLG